ncbi:MAG: signal peptidase II [Acidimicrobiales bacterium]
MGATAARHRGTFLGAAAVVVALDQLTKQWALSALADGPVDLVGSLRLNLVFNDRAAFSLGGSGNTAVIAALGLVIVAVVTRMGLRAERRGWALGLGIVLGGALGNLADRAFRAGDGFLGGRVVDMVDLQWWPVFNLADASLWVGIGVLLLDSRREHGSAS